MPELKRNTADSLLRVGAPNLPRTRHVFPTRTHTTSAKHGDIFPFLCMPVYPGDSFNIDSNWFVKADPSLRVPLDDINFDVYYFFVPTRLLDVNFAKTLGDKDPYDSTAYTFPILDITSMYNSGNDQQGQPNSLLYYLGWSHAPNSAFAAGTGSDRISPYPLAAYWQVINDYFVDENLDYRMDYATYLYNQSISFADAMDAGIGHTKVRLPNVQKSYFFPFIANKLSDPMTRGLISPQYGDAVKIPSSTYASIVPNGDNMKVVLENETSYRDLNVNTSSIAYVSGTAPGTAASVIDTNLQTKLKESMGTIQELQLAFNLQGLRNKQMKYGHRYIEQIHGLWGIDLPDVLVGRAEYLGGTASSLGMVPILATDSANLGKLAGNSNTLFNDGGFFKSFGEYGYIIGMACTRVHHRYTQGKDTSIFDIFDPMDLYNPVFANLGPEQNKTQNIWNVGNANTNSIFNFIESNTYLRQTLDRVSGVFNPNTGADWDEFRQLWSYADYYVSAPSFNATWLKEDAKNVSRTVSGRIIAHSPYDASANPLYAEAPQFLFSIYSHITKTAILPAHPHPDYLFGRL